MTDTVKKMFWPARIGPLTCRHEIKMQKNLFLVTLCEQNGDYEYERTGLIKADKDANAEAEQIASRWYSERGEPCGMGFHSIKAVFASL